MAGISRNNGNRSTRASGLIFKKTSALAPKGWRGVLRIFGPGLVTGASDDDPSGIATYSQAGAQFGLGLVWVSLVTLPLMAGVQEICDRTALATGHGLGELASKKFAGKARRLLALLIAALIIANTLNIAADLVAIGSGMTFSNLVMFAIIVAATATLQGKPINSAADAATALAPIAGLLGKSFGFSRSIRKAPVLYGLVIIGTVGRAVLSLITNNLIQLLVIVAVINGVAAALLLLAQLLGF